MKLMFDDVLSLDGTIDIDNIFKAQKRDLWVYVYYLFRNNMDVPIFKNMMQEKAPIRASADNFVNEVKGYLKSRGLSSAEHIDKQDIGAFINYILKDFDIKVPFLNTMLVRLEKAVAKNNEQLAKGIDVLNSNIVSARNILTNPKTKLYIEENGVKYPNDKMNVDVTVRV